MDIVVGIDSIKTVPEIKPLVDAGAEEFFCGYIPEYWSKEYEWEIAPNRRSYKEYNYASLEDLSLVADSVHKLHKKIMLTVNEHEYPPERMGLSIRMVKETLPLRFDSVIVSNIALALELREAGVDTPFHVSIGGLANNYEAVRFWNKHVLNIRRFILPRDITVSEIKSLAEKGRDDGVTFEVFGIGNICAFSDGYCLTWHSSRTPSFCTWFLNGERKLISITDEIGKSVSLKTTVDFRGPSFDSERDKFLDSQVRTCGLCAVPLFKEWGISAIKVPTRGENNRAVLIPLVKQAMELKLPEDCKKIIGSENFCSGARCYYNYPSERNV
ncbi:MAG: U32 family peptidase [Parcubacteria group bacterium]